MWYSAALSNPAAVRADFDRWHTPHRLRNEIYPIAFRRCDLAHDYEGLVELLQDFGPDVLIHFAEQPSAPFSMKNRRSAVETQHNNVLGTLNLIFAMRDICPQAHLIKLGTMGEYGTPNIDIEEGWLELLEDNGRRDRVLLSSKSILLLYLSSKVRNDSLNLEFACRVWNMRGDRPQPRRRLRDRDRRDRLPKTGSTRASITMQCLARC